MEGLQIAFAAVFIMMFFMMIGTSQLVHSLQKIKKDIKEFKIKKQKEITDLRNTNTAYKGANTKHKETIEELKIQNESITYMTVENWELTEWLLESRKQIDESKPMCEKLLTMVKKGSMEEAKAVVKGFYQM